MAVVAYNFHTNSKIQNLHFLKIYCHVLNCQQFITFLQTLRRWHIWHTSVGKKRDIGREDSLISLDSLVSRLATRLLYPTDSLKKIKRLFAVCYSTYWHTLYKKLQKQIQYTGPLFNK